MEYIINDFGNNKHWRLKHLQNIITNQYLLSCVEDIVYVNTENFDKNINWVPKHFLNKY